MRSPTDIEIEAAADAMRGAWDGAKDECERLGVPAGLAWRCLAEVGLRAADRVRGKLSVQAPELNQ